MVGQPTFWNPPARARGQVLQRGGVRPDGFDFRTLWKAPLSPCGLSEENPPPPFLTPSSLFLPQQPGGVLPPPRPWWSQAGPRQGFPLRAFPATPHPATPKILGSMFTFSFECQQRGSLPEAPVRAGGPGRVVFPLSCPHLHPGERSTSQGRWVPQSCHYRCLTERVWHFFFICLHISFTCLPSAAYPA